MSTSEGLRRRRPADGGTPATPSPTSSKPPPFPAPPAAADPRPATGVALLSSLLVIAAFYGALRARHEVLLPRPGAAGASPAEGAFDVDGAMRHVRAIAGKERPLGSKELDESLEYVLREVEALRTVAERNGMVLEVETFTSSGSYPCSVKPVPVVVSYADVLSVVAKLSPREKSGGDDGEKALLVNGHVDSAVDAPGANDCAACVAVGMEALAAIARTPVSATGLARPIVFLFNGAEEVLLAGAHGFVTSHRWAKDIVAHINLEAMGSGDRYALFQLGPQNLWLAEAYAKAVKQPWASVAGSDIFEATLIPGETDFRIFKEHGIPGYDFALIQHGEVYHTRYDDVKHVTRDALAHGGQGIVLPLALELAGASDAIGNHLRRGTTESDAASLSFRIARFLPSMAELKPGQQGRPAFFDFMGLFTVVYPDSVARCAVWALTFITFALWSGAVPVGIASVDASGPVALRIRMLGSLFAAFCGGVASATTAAVFYVYLLERPLSWYGSPRFAFAVFSPPCIIGATVALQLTLPRDCSAKIASASMQMSVAQFYAGVMFGIAFAGALVSYIPMIMVITCLAIVVLPIRSDWVFFRFLLLLVPASTVGFVTSWDGVGPLIGVLGRSGKLQSDIVVSVVLSFYTAMYGLVPILPLYAYYPLALPRIRKYFLIFAVLVATLVAMLEELTLPHRNEVYSKDAPKRILATHFHSPGQDPPDTLALVPLDVIPVDVNTTIRMFPFSDKDMLEKTPQWGELKSTSLEPVRPFMTFLSMPSIFKVEERVQLAVPTAEVLSEELNTQDPEQVSVLIAVSAPDSTQMSLRLPLKAHGGVVESWSLSDELVDLGDGGGPWVRHVGRSPGKERLEFSVTVKKNPETGQRPPITFDVSCARTGTSQSETLRRLYFPQWTAPVFIQATGAGFSL